MRLALTALLHYRRGLHAAVDGIATSLDGDTAGARHFVPGLLPCGECPLCRRALVGACAARRQVLDPQLSAAGAAPPLDLPDRFLTAIDDPPGLDALADETAALAGVVASALSAMALVGAAPGDQAFWLGTDAIAVAGAELARARGLKSADLAATAGTPAESSGAETRAGHGRSQRLLFVTTPDPATVRRAATLAEPGSVLLLMIDGTLSLPEGLVLPSDARLLLQGAYHPDLVPEALAALRRGELDLPRAADHTRFERRP